MKSILFVILVLVFNISQAQSTHQRKPKVIQLSSTLTQPHHFNNAIRSIEIFIAHSDTNRLGFIQTSLLNTTRDAVPDKPFQNYFEEYVTRTYGGQFKENGKDLLWVLRYIRIGERLSTNLEKAFVRIKADAFMSAGKVEYQLAGVIDTVIVIERFGGKDVTDSHSLNLEKALDLLVSIADKASIKSRVYPREEIIRKELSLFQAPAFTTDTFKTGVYMSYQDFLLNAPSVIKFTAADKNDVALIFAINEDGSQTLIANPWGICYNGQLFKFHKRIYIPFARQGRAFLFNNYLNLRGANNLVSTSGNTNYGLMGLFVKQPYKGDDPMNITTFPYINGLLPEANCIDPFTGILMF